jgi:hypothetical protein
MIQAAVLPVLALMQSSAQEPAPAPVVWQGFDYSYIEASYVLADVDGLGEDVDGFAVAASLDVAQSVFGYIGLQATSADTGGGDVDLDVLELGLGMHAPLGDRLDLVASAAGLLADAEALGLSDDETGYRLRGGARYHLTPRLELGGGFGVVDLDDPETVFDAALLVGLTGPLHLRAGLELGEDVTAFSLGLRLYPGF